MTVIQADPLNLFLVRQMRSEWIPRSLNLRKVISAQQLLTMIGVGRVIFHEGLCRGYCKHPVCGFSVKVVIIYNEVPHRVAVGVEYCSGSDVLLFG
jgi:hypothetical protein